MHGNTVNTDMGVKTRRFDSIREELKAFFDVHAQCGSHPGGVYLEMTGEYVTECLDSNINKTKMENLVDKYYTSCDPRLNGDQSLELAFLVAERLRRVQGLSSL